MQENALQQLLDPQENDGKFTSGLKRAGNGVVGWLAATSTLITGAATIFMVGAMIACGGAAIGVVGAGLYYGTTLAATAAMGAVATLGVGGVAGTVLSGAAAVVAGSVGFVLGGGAGGIFGILLGLGAKNGYEGMIDAADGTRSLAQATGRYFRRAFGKVVAPQAFTTQLVSHMLETVVPSVVALSGMTLGDAFGTAVTAKPAAQQPEAVSASPQSSLSLK